MEGLPADLDPQLSEALKGIEKEFEVGKLSLADVFNYYAPRLTEAFRPVSATDWDEYMAKLVAGDSSAILVTVFAAVAGALVAKKFLSVLFPDDGDAQAGGEGKKKGEEEEEEIVLGDFTLEQLREFDGEDDKPIYVALRQEVFDVSSARDFYGKDSSYHCFAGREASRAMAKMSFDEADLADGLHLDDLGPFDRSILEDWYQKFKYYKCYPMVGKVSLPPTGLELTVAELGAFDGKQAVPSDRVDAPIYIAIRGTILDVSYGGKNFYSGECGYAVLAGKEASRALGKMSLSAEDYNSTDISDLTEEQVAAVDDWLAKLGKKYPVVGTVKAGEVAPVSPAKKTGGKGKSKGGKQ